MKNLILVALLAFMTFGSAISQTLCENGFAGIYPCDKVDLMAFLPKADIGGGNMNDIWGWTDPLDGKEYVIACKTTGTAFIDISDPVNPIYLGSLPTHSVSSTWRDAKVYNNYAFIVSEAGGHGMQVFDLTRLRDVANPPELFTEDAHYALFGNAHNIAINELTGFAYAVGSGTFGGGLHIVDISDPLNPVLAGDYATDGYTHDTQVVIYNGPHVAYQGREIAFSCNEETLTITDVTVKDDTQTISVNPYDAAAYSHQGWLTEDQKYFLLGDELDEMQQGHNTRTYIWNVENLEQPVLIGFFEAPVAAIDHNMYVRGSNVYQSNYRAGLRIIDLTDLENGVMTQAGFFDVFPTSNIAHFSGSWSNYPYFASGVIPVSHIDAGVFLVRPRFMEAQSVLTAYCETEPAVINLTYHLGFGGPVEPVFLDLPGGASATFSQTGFSAPAAITVEISGLAAGTHNPSDWGLTHYSNIDVLSVVMDFTFEVEASTEYFMDTDLDGFGDDSNTAMACIQPPGTVAVGGDCDDQNNLQYPGAPGNASGIDNNCNGFIDTDEEINCAIDLNGDGFVGFADLVLLTSEYGCATNCMADFNGDGSVSFADLTYLQNFFGSTCP